MGIVEDIEALAAIPAPTFAEQARLGWIERRLAAAPGERCRDAVGNLLWSWGGGRPDLVVAAHVDSVFPADTKLGSTRAGGDLVGPGVGDNAAAVAVALTVTESLLAGGPLAAGAVAFTVGEEGLGNLRGATSICERLRPAAFVALEGHGLEHVIVDAVGSLRARLTVIGPGGHSWVDRGAPSAINGLLRCAHELLGLGDATAPVNIGTIAGGRSVNTIADRAQCLVERRALGDAPLQELAAALRALAVDDGLALEVETLGQRPAGRLARDAPLLAAVREVRARLGLPDELGDGSTDANAAIARGIPAVCLGVARGSGMHTLDERIDVGSLDLGAAQLREVMCRLLGEPGAGTPSS